MPDAPSVSSRTGLALTAMRSGQAESEVSVAVATACKDFVDTLILCTRDRIEKGLGTESALHHILSPEQKGFYRTLRSWMDSDGSQVIDKTDPLEMGRKRLVETIRTHDDADALLTVIKGALVDVQPRFTFECTATACDKEDVKAMLAEYDRLHGERSPATTQTGNNVSYASFGRRRTDVFPGVLYHEQSEKQQEGNGSDGMDIEVDKAFLPPGLL